MLRSTGLRITIVAALGLSLAGCITSQSEQSAIEAIVSNPANVDAAKLEAAIEAFNPSLAAKIEATAASASTLVQTACGILPLASSLAQIAAAAYGATGVVQPATELAAAFCTPFRVTKVSVSRNAKRLVAAPVQAAKGVSVSRPFEYAGVKIYAKGVVVNPALVH